MRSRNTFTVLIIVLWSLAPWGGGETYPYNVEALKANPPRTRFEIKNGDIAGYRYQRHIRTSFTIRNDGTSSENLLRLWVNIFLERTSYQVVTALMASHSGWLERDERGNGLLLFEIKDLRSYSTKIVTLDMEARIAESAQQVITDPAIYLVSEPLIPKDHEKIQGLAKRLKKKTDKETALGIYQWMGKNIMATGYMREDKGALYALENLTGDCTEHASLFAALCRANGIPARVLGGYYCEGSCSSREIFHMWAEFYADGRWFLVDPMKRHFDDNVTGYRALENFYSNSSGPLGKQHRYFLESSSDNGSADFNITAEDIIS